MPGEALLQDDLAESGRKWGIIPQFQVQTGSVTPIFWESQWGSWILSQRANVYVPPQYLKLKISCLVPSNSKRGLSMPVGCCLWCAVAPLKLHEGSWLSAFPEFIFNITCLSTLLLYPQIPLGALSVGKSQCRPWCPMLQEEYPATLTAWL